ncbi:response regulator [Planomonospora venezuelensis]|uniref:CheY-like chemotaxis protein n=1 Tax=Planomonospora venezuelensis TaxID=1999 RepID=A0A841DAT8_PLAVE|nr:response regulator [Planomonospora venezuelensis]MBB5967130.1 CheY-like chemotaxis protein [Planomonospora venezuelensis]GIN04861.1 response regulator receiver modulated metal-depenent phosphohydrolase [Planomonospora venezuelensis]
MSDELPTELWRRAPAFAGEAPSILLVDDEPTVLQTLSHQLGGNYRVVTAPDGLTALDALDRHGPFAAIVSDMRMPGMDGIELLEQVRLRHPEISRVLHTAQADLSSAISAINEGQVFRFLCKPCPTRELRGTVRDAVEHHRLVTAEREILDKTLRTSLQALFGCLELASPQAFARAGRIRDLVGELCRELGLSNVWEIEVAAMASQLGAVTLPPSVLQKLDRGLPLPDDEQKMIDAMPGITARLLGDVPMLEDVVEIVRGLQPADGGEPHAPVRPSGPMVPVAIDVLRAAIEFEAFASRDVAAENAVAVLEERGGYDAEVLAALRRARGVTAPQETVRPFRVGELEVGMRIAEDVVAVNGPVLIGRGLLVTEMLLERLTNYKHIVQIVEPIWAAVPGTSVSAPPAVPVPRSAVAA